MNTNDRMIPDNATRRLIDACDGAIGELANGGTHRIDEMIRGIAKIRDDIAQGRWLDDEWDQLEAEVERLRGALVQARADLAALLRGHTRAIWALKGTGSYTDADSTPVALAAQDALRDLNAAINSVTGGNA